MIWSIASTTRSALFGEIDRLWFDDEIARARAGDYQQVLDDARDFETLIRDEAEEFLAFGFAGDASRIAQLRGDAHDRGERSPYLMGDRCHQLVLGREEILEFALGIALPGDVDDCHCDVGEVERAVESRGTPDQKRLDRSTGHGQPTMKFCCHSVEVVHDRPELRDERFERSAGERVHGQFADEDVPTRSLGESEGGVIDIQDSDEARDAAHLFWVLNEVGLEILNAVI